MNQVRHSGLRVALVGKPVDLTYEYDALGEGADALQALLTGSSPFASVLQKATQPVILLGTGALLRPDGAAISAMAQQLSNAAASSKKGWIGYSVLHSTSSAVGALDVGFVPGPTAVPLEKLKLVYLMAADDVPAQKVAEDAFVIYQGHHGDSGAQMADLILPGAAYTEKAATYVNTEGRVQRTSRAVDPPGWCLSVTLMQAVAAYRFVMSPHSSKPLMLPQDSHPSEATKPHLYPPLAPHAS